MERKGQQHALEDCLPLSRLGSLARIATGQVLVISL